MGTFGERLQREREMRGITLEEIAEATKIGTRSLRALEEQDFDKLPGGIFNKGFVRAYSKYLGIDEDQAVADYVTAVNEAQSTGKLTRPEYAPPTIDEGETDKPEPIRIPWALLILVALVVAVGFAAKSYYAQHGWAKLKREATPVSRPQSPPATQQTTPGPAGVASADTAQKAPDTSPAPARNPAAVAGDPAEEFVVKVRAKEDSWIWMSADGQPVASELLKANSEKVVRAAKKVVLSTGNPPGIEVLRNDTLLPSLGSEKVKRTVTITAQDMRQ